MLFYVHLISFLLMLCGLTGCNNSGKMQMGVSIECKIQNPLPGSSLYIGDRFGFRKVESDSMSEDLVWQRDSVSGPLLLSAYFYRIENGCIYVEPGDSLKLEFDGHEIRNSLNNLSFQGDRRIENEFLIMIKQVFNKESSYELDFYNCPESEFIERVDSLRNHGMELIDLYLNEHPENVSFEQFVREYVNYTCALYLINYPIKYRYIFGHRDYFKSKALEKKIQDIVKLERPDLVDHFRYVEFLLERISGLSALNEFSRR